MVATALAFGHSLNCRSLTLFSSNTRSHRLSSFLLNLLNSTSCTRSLPTYHLTCPVVCAILSGTVHLIVTLDTAQDTSAIAASLGFVAIAALIIFTMALCLIGEHRSQTREKRGSVTAPVIDICRPAHSNGERDSYMAEPQWPREAYLSGKPPSTLSPDTLSSLHRADQILPKLGNPPPVSGSSKDTMKL